MRSQIINFSQTGIVVCLYVLVGYAAVDLVPCDKSRRVFSNSWGVITDGPMGSNYTQDSHCEWLIKANQTNKFITLSFRSMGTECSYDYVFVYDGDSFRSPLLGSFSGKTEPQQVIASSGYMLILLYSDTNYVLDGFRAEFSITDCPNNCSSHGVCFNHSCVCENDWGGFDCSKRLCPNDCGSNFNRGRCETGQCLCFNGFSGQSCSLDENDKVGNKWHWLSHSEVGMTPRAAHTAVYVRSTDSLYVFGGYNLNNILSNLEIYNFKNSSWTDEFGQVLRDYNLINSIDPASLPKLLQHAGEDWQKNWGVPPGSSFFRNVIHAVTDNTTFPRPRQRHSKKTDGIVLDGIYPMARYGHAACQVDEGFVMFGGKIENSSLSNELWLYNVERRRWELRGQFSDKQPPPLTRHTLTIARNRIYLFGGSTEDGEFSSRLFSIILEPDGSEQWQEIKARGGKELDVRVVAHTTVYHHVTNSLLVYGGIVAGVARFSKLSDRMFAFQLDNRHWTEIHYTREYLRDRYVPRERAFHTANILGNYLIVFGGYSHRHNKEEICYDNQMYLYHLGCHIWVNPEILGKSNNITYPKQQGVFAHAASVRKGNTLLLVGGYHGNVNGDLLAYIVPSMIAAKEYEHYEPETSCVKHRNHAECSADPECGWCSADDMCYGRTVSSNCTTNLQTTRCPGICPALGDCHSCLIHGHGQRSSKPVVSAALKLGLAECTWCVQNARCHHKDDNYGVCGLREDSPSQMPGWWGSKGTEIIKAEECREFDRRPGLTFVKYHHPVNLSQPDHVAIINATTVDFNSPTSPILKAELGGGEMVARLMGFLRPPENWNDMLKVCASFCNATLKIADNLIVNITATNNSSECHSQEWPLAEQSNRVAVDFESHKYVSIGAYTANNFPSKMGLQHNKDKETPKVFTFEYLEPYANGTCTQYRNCLHCLTDSQCGWCDASNKCVSRLEDESLSCRADGDWRYLTLQPSACSNCSNYISCESCVNSGLCEWWIEEAKCSRRGLLADAAVSLHQCPVPCYKRPDCSSCLEQRGRCVWCEATQQCFSFSVYTSEYQFGLCREWLDQAFPLVSAQENSMLSAPRPQEQCKSCSHHSNCSTCLSSLSCGWCYNSSNPITGMCVQGDFNNPHMNCSEILNIPNARWAYAHCPDVDECGLGLHDCHPQAICTNTDGSFSCHCRKGYQGDGRTSCTRTCYHDCKHGVCQGEPDYTCKCNLGWTGEDCSINCGCNNHSTCHEGVGICDECQDWTTGDFCDKCLAGSYGNATNEKGCRQCECNGHGDKYLGECNSTTGICYCQDNTEGDNCDRCKPNYYGDPRNGKLCYYQCEARGMLTDLQGQGIGSKKQYTAPWGGLPIRECLWIIKPNVETGSAIIQLLINASDLNITCGENAVYVYDALPELVDMGSQSALSAVICNEEALPTTIVESRTGYLTVHYKQGLPLEGFNAVYNVLTCDNCNYPRRCKNGQCVCEDGSVGPYCNEQICPHNCSYAVGQGTCDTAYGRCLCASGWGGPSCAISLINKTQLVFEELFNTAHLVDNLEHLRKTLPRFGHSLSADRRGSLWMFGGYSLSHGPLNDIRLFDTRNSTWMQVTIESTPDARMPQGRYFHGADILHSKQAIFVFGGLTKQGKSNRTLDDFWQFDIQNQRWREIEKHSAIWPAPVAGHTLTSYRNSTSESLILIGGVSPQAGFMNMVWEYKLDKECWEAWETRGFGPLGIFGHTAMFHPDSNSLYVFGGYVFNNKQSVLSNNLYMLNYDLRTWTELNVFSSTQVNIPSPRFLHTAVTTGTHMIVLGGRISPWNISDTLYAYSFSCNRWINLMSNGVEKIGPLPGQTYAQAMTIDPEGDTAYVIGGWGSDSQCSVFRLQLPNDLCSLWSNRQQCLGIPGCGYCSLTQSQENTNNSIVFREICHNNNNSCPLTTVLNSSRASNQGTTCNGPHLYENCSHHAMQTCTNCLRALAPDGSELGCKWCDDKCSKTCDNKAITVIEQCPFNHCQASDCVQCQQQGSCDWNGRTCNPKKLEENLSNKSCKSSCTKFTTCSDCLDEPGCRWSTQLDECISSLYQTLYCAGGVCGLVLQKDDQQYCPEPCSSFTQCSNCLRHAHCGWCAADDNSGIGRCTEGSSERPMNGTCSDIFQDDNSEVNITWHYVKCPAEDECANGHHKCKPDSELCVDLPEGFQCSCGNGYKPGPSGCQPVCKQGCVHGQCILPDVCECNFGYVGANCSIECLCNGHSNCEGPDKLDKCLKCENNTMGEQCEKCKPLFVGDPVKGGRCIPCSEYCYGHTSVCVADNSTDLEAPDLDFELDLASFREGPKGPARCIRCDNRTTGSRCDKCIKGNFRGDVNLTLPCKPCECHGHGDTCDPETGEKCNCQNNTESEICTGAKNSAARCWEMQCTKCKDGYSGTPKAGHQCYKQMNMDSKMCFDAKPIEECKMKPKALHPGEMVFFMIQPRFMNVDIRIMIDVTQGKLNVFMSTHEDTYVVYPNMTTGLNEIELDTRYGFYKNGTQKTDDVLLTQEAIGLRTYITITQPKTMLAVTGLKDRLVITLPEELHALESTRFFLVLQALEPPDTDKKVSYGIVFFRQDQLHIDLFVFFSVFFSCFFLFLAACVVAWKAKQAADVRRARRRHVVEMLHMAKRPFASVTLQLQPRPKPKRSAHYDLRPVAVEPTDDGLAAVATVFVSLPGGQSASVKLALASSLILLARQFPAGSRAFLRRRSTHAAPPT